MGLTLDDFTYNTAIDSFCKVGMVDEAVELFDFMRTKGSTMSSPTAKTYVMMAMVLIKNDCMEEFFKLLGDTKQSLCLPDVSTYKELMEGMCVAGKIEEAYSILEERGNEGNPPDILTYNCFLKVLCDNGNIDEAIRLYGRIIRWVACLWCKLSIF
ncbi:hypothetical protein MLD38_012455 [Melastoma candidum]|uniref:Uncharacterized protein n=1 Tax=Melastoma candidum TaxID=119954 RepID=A0ACB9RA06_9MYRT|nr:hypothetical protein MLD38_012455 [Melastoma candidum]